VRDPAIHARSSSGRRHGAGARLARAGHRLAITGPEGNREFLVDLAPGPGCAEIGERIAERPARDVARIGFAYNPTFELRSS